MNFKIYIFFLAAALGSEFAFAQYSLSPQDQQHNISATVGVERGDVTNHQGYWMDGQRGGGFAGGGGAADDEEVFGRKDQGGEWFPRNDRVILYLYIVLS